MTFPSVRLEGAILSPELFARVEDLAGQRPVDFGLPAGSAVKDEIARAWVDAQDYWRIFQRKLDTLPANATATTETGNLWLRHAPFGASVSSRCAPSVKSLRGSNSARCAERQNKSPQLLAGFYFGVPTGIGCAAEPAQVLRTRRFASSLLQSLRSFRRT